MKIAGKTLEEWTELARHDDCLDRLVPSDLRLLIGQIPAKRVKAELYTTGEGDRYTLPSSKVDDAKLLEARLQNMLEAGDDGSDEWYELEDKLAKLLRLHGIAIGSGVLRFENPVYSSS